MNAVVDDGDMLLAAQRRLLQNRKNADLDESGRSLSVPMLTGSAEASRLTVAHSPAPLGAALGSVPVPGQYACRAKVRGGRCGAAIEFPGVCPACAKRAEAEERGEQIRSRIATNIPPMFADVTWRDIHRLQSMVGGRLRVKEPAERIASIRRGLETERRSVLVGPAGSGKSTLAAAYIREALERGSERARFIPAIDLEDTEEGARVYDLALGADELVLDDLGAELHGAPAEGGIAAQRIKMVDKLIGVRFNLNKGVVITTPHDKDALRNIYGAGIVRRLTDGAATVRIGAAA